MKKILATILAISLVLGTLFTGMGAVVSAETAEEVPPYLSDATGQYLLFPYEVTDYNTKYSKGTSLSSCEGVSISANGVDGTYCLKSEGTGTTIATYVNIGGVEGYLEKNQTYVIEYKAKVDGTIANLSDCGLYNTVVSWFGGYNWYYNNASATIGDWKTFSSTINYCPDSTVSGGWDEFHWEWRLPEGSTLYIDDVVIYNAADESKTNLFPKGSFDKKVSVEEYTSEKVVFDLSSYDSIKYCPDKSLSNNANVSMGIENGTGYIIVDGSGKSEQGWIGYGGSSGYLSYGVEYTVKVDVKKSGTINSFKVGTSYCWDTYWGDAVSNDDISEEWSTLTFKFAYPEGLLNYWQNLIMNWDIPVGSKLYIDNIVIYKSEDEAEDGTATNLWSNARASFADIAHYEANVNNAINTGAVYAACADSDYGHAQAGTEVLANQAFDSIVQEGYDNSYAFKATSTGGVNKKTVLYLASTSDSNYVKGDVYRIGFKAKKSGTVGNLTIRYTVSSPWSQTNVFTTAVTDEWVYYGAEFVMPESAGGWKFLHLVYNVSDDSALWVDDIEVYNVTDTYKRNLFAKGSFDSKRYFTYDVESTVTDGIAYAPYSDNYYENTWENANNPDVDLLEEEYASLVAEGVNGTFALKLEAGDTAISHNKLSKLAMQGASGITAGNTYRLGFKAKKVGTVSNFNINLETTNTWKTYNGILAVDLTDDWVYYGVDIKFNDGILNNLGHKHWGISCTINANSAVYIDDVEFYDISDPDKKNLYYSGAGSFDKESYYYASELVTEQTDGYAYEVIPINKYQINDSTNYPDYPLKDWDNGAALGDAVTTVADEGVNGSGALKILGVAEESGDTIEHEISLNLGIGALENNTKYILKFKAKVSEDEALDSFVIGIRRRWEWSNKTLGVEFVAPNEESGVSQIDSNWREFTVEVTTDDSYVGNYNFVYISYHLLADTELYIDDVALFKAEDNSAVSFNDTKGTFDIKCEKFNVLADAGVAIAPKYYTNYKAEPTVQDGAPVDGFTAKTVTVDNTPEGSNVLMVGHNEDAYSGRVFFELPAIRPRGTYQVDFWVMPYGNITSANMRINDNDPYIAINKPVATVDESGATVYVKDKITSEIQTANPPESTNVYSYGMNNYTPKVWTKVSLVLTDKTTITAEQIEAAVNEKIKANEELIAAGFSKEDLQETEVSYRWAGMDIVVSGDAGSGILIDNLSIKEIATFGEDAPNLFNNGSFETIVAPEVTWDNTFYGENATDYSFMDSLDKEIYISGGSLTNNSKIFTDVLAADGDFNYNNTYIIGSTNIDVARFEAKYAVEQGKKVWLSANPFASKGENKYAARENWKENITRMAAFIQNDIGNAFQGFYFDEPHTHYASNEEFIEITKYMRETLKKRVFSMTKHDMFSGTTTDTCRVSITAESHAYVTDIGYWNYQIKGMEGRIEGFKKAVAKLDGNVRKWICPLYGSENDAVTEEQTMQIFNSMLAGAKDIEGFGGIMLYSLGDTNGYNLHKLDENGVAQYNNYRNLLIAVAGEFKNEFSTLKSDALNEDGVLVFDSFDADVAGAISYAGGVAVGEVKTGAKVTVTSLTSDNTAEYEIAVKNDVNGDGAVSILDLIRSKKIAAGAVEGSAAQYAAAGSTVSGGITATILTAIKNILLG